MTRDQLKKLERDLWAAADKLRANSDLEASEYSTPVLGLIFLKFADNKYRQHEDAILAEYSKLKGTRRERSLQDIAIEKCGFALGPQARYDYLLNLPEKEDIPKAIRSAMASIEASKPELLGVLPQQEYDRFSRNPQNRSLPKALLKLFSDIPLDASGDVFGQIYEYFLGNFAMSEGQGASAPLRGRASLSRPLLARTGHALVCTLLQTTSGFSGVNCGRGNLGRKDGRGRVPRVERKERLKDLRE